MPTPKHKTHDQCGCGRLKYCRSDRCRECWLADVPEKGKIERNQALFADYVEGQMSRAELAERYDLSESGVAILLYRHRITLPSSERKRRCANAGTGGTGRPPVWPDCPPHLRHEYARLRRTYKIPATEARRILEADERRREGA